MTASSGPPEWQDMAQVGRVARPHGNRGGVIVDPHTDFLEARFKPGAVLFTKRGDRVEELTIAAVRFHRGRPIVEFEGISSMNAAEALGKPELRVPVEALQPLPPGSFYQHDLIGCEVRTVEGQTIGRVSAIEGAGAESRLVVDAGGEDVLVPLAEEICVEVDVAARRIVVQPPDGLLELNARSPKRDRRGAR